MTTYYANFSNDTTETWTMAVWQTLPDSPGLDSVSWKQTTVPQSGFSGVSWNITYDVAIANYQQAGGIGVYTASQLIQGIDLGTAWKIVFQNNVQQLEPDGNADSGSQILITNASNLTANPGIGMSGAGSVYKQGVLSGAAAQFEVTPTYWIGLFNQVQLGQVISSNVIVGPQEVVFPSGLNAADVTATVNGESIQMNVTYSTQSSVSQAAVEAHKKYLAALR